MTNEAVRLELIRICHNLQMKAKSENADSAQILAQARREIAELQARQKAEQ